MPQWRLRDREGNFHPAELRLMNQDEATMLHNLGWEKSFNWADVSLKGNGPVLKLIAEGDIRIHGAINYAVAEDHIEIGSLESAPINRYNNTNRIYQNVADVLIGEACLKSYELGFDGCVAFQAKSNLIDYYKQRFGAIIFSGGRVLIETASAQKLIELYYW